MPRPYPEYRRTNRKAHAFFNAPARRGKVTVCFAS